MKNQKQKPILFWSGGKDSWLAYQTWTKQKGIPPVLLTTYDDESKIIPYQNIHVQTVYRQAIKLGLTLIPVALSHPVSNEVYIQTVTDAIDQSPFEHDTLLFGDWHLEDIRKWREEAFGNLGYQCIFPIWQKPIEELIGIIESEDAEIRISSIDSKFNGFIKEGTLFNQRFIEHLPESMDPMGENGEFHTEVILSGNR